MKVVRCPSCNSENDAYAAFCHQCKSRLRVPRGVDQGWCLRYSDLSFRRKFFRTLWLTPLSPLVLLFPSHMHILGLISPKSFFILLLVVSAAQVAYTFYRWRSLEARNG
jgi:hypothetical protein